MPLQLTILADKNFAHHAIWQAIIYTNTYIAVNTLVAE